MAPDLNSIVDGGAATTGRGKPNILYIMADQLAAPQLKMYNPDSQIKTPNLDRLAEGSVQFDSAYCPSPLCAPSRMSMITGLLPMKIGAYDNASQINSEIPTYAHYLRTKGYHTALAGKMHFVGDQLHGYETRLTSDIYPGDFGWAVNWDEPDTRLEWYHNASSILQAGPCGRSNQLDYDEEVMYRSTQYLWDHVREGPNKRPFALTVSVLPKLAFNMAANVQLRPATFSWTVVLTFSRSHLLTHTILTPSKRSTGTGTKTSILLCQRFAWPRKTLTHIASVC